MTGHAGMDERNFGYSRKRIQSKRFLLSAAAYRLRSMPTPTMWNHIINCSLFSWHGKKYWCFVFVQIQTMLIFNFLPPIVNYTFSASLN